MEGTEGVERIPIGSWEAVVRAKDLSEKHHKELSRLIYEYNRHLPVMRIESASSPLGKLKSSINRPLEQFGARVINKLGLDMSGVHFVLWNKTKTRLVGMASLSREARDVYDIAGVYVMPAARGDKRAIPMLLKAVYEYIRTKYPEGREAASKFVSFTRLASSELSKAFVERLGAIPQQDSEATDYFIPLPRLAQFVKNVDNT
jgi:hypothetical protein